MNRPYPALCRDCKWSAPEKGFEWNLKCFQPTVNGNDPYALAAAKSHGDRQSGGTSCSVERDKKWFVKCGMKGKLWEC